MDPQFDWKIGEIPFSFVPLKDWRENFSLPTKLSFEVALNIRTGTVIQKTSAVTEAALERAYSLGSIFSGMMEENGLGRSYADDFLRFVLASVSPDRLVTAKVLEIGCGTGFLLSRLKPHCSRVLGIEPGGHSRAGAKAYDVTIIHDFFPSEQLTDKYDVVLAYAVLEHIQNPVNFLRSIASVMYPGSLLLLAVPDCNPYIQAGDISMFWHEHWNYFTADSLIRNLVAAGFKAIDLRAAGFGGLLYACAVNTATSMDLVDMSLVLEQHKAFIARGKRAVSRLLDFLTSARRVGQSVGFYVPGRVINLLTVTGASHSGCRFFDDNQILWGTFFPGIPIRVENRHEWAANPPDLTIIMSNTFGAKIRGELEALKTVRGNRILTWEDLFGDCSRQLQ
jgi:2-polyprenyl-3-methyl-5-hydroxy-6-metoxy-1,4-benzoquinol methylase